MHACVCACMVCVYVCVCAGEGVMHAWGDAGMDVWTVEVVNCGCVRSRSQLFVAYTGEEPGNEARCVIVCRWWMCANCACDGECMHCVCETDLC